MLICPVCHASLTWYERTVECCNRHTFDRAQEGYINLRLTGRRPHNEPGDTRKMLRARRAFLDAGWYAPLSDAVNRCVLDHFQDVEKRTDRHILDLGCGEGYYLGHLMQALRGASKAERYHGFGMDTAKDAVRYAARRYPEERWCVANVARLTTGGSRCHHEMGKVQLPVVTLAGTALTT